jgi:hypothetical protein
MPRSRRASRLRSRPEPSQVHAVRPYTPQAKGRAAQGGKAPLCKAPLWGWNPLASEAQKTSNQKSSIR